jgi:hypothetical protein
MGTDPTGIHRHLEKVTMETLYEGHPEKRVETALQMLDFSP